MLKSTEKKHRKSERRRRQENKRNRDFSGYSNSSLNLESSPITVTTARSTVNSQVASFLLDSTLESRLDSTLVIDPSSPGPKGQGLTQTSIVDHSSSNSNSQQVVSGKSLPTTPVLSSRSNSTCSSTSTIKPQNGHLKFPPTAASSILSLSLNSEVRVAADNGNNRAETPKIASQAASQISSSSTKKDLNVSSTSSDFSWAYDQFEINIAKRIAIIYNNINSVFYKKANVDIFKSDKGHEKNFLNEYGMSREILNEVAQWHETFGGQMSGGEELEEGFWPQRVGGGGRSKESGEARRDYKALVLDELLNWEEF